MTNISQVYKLLYKAQCVCYIKAVRHQAIMFEFTTKVAISSILVTAVRDCVMITGITGRDILRLATTTLSTSMPHGSGAITNEDLRQQIAALDLDQKLLRYTGFLSELQRTSEYSLAVNIRSAIDAVNEMIEIVERLLHRLDRSLGLDAPSRIETAANLLYLSRKAETNVLTPINSKNVAELRLYAALLDSRFDYLVDLLKLQTFGCQLFKSTSTYL